mmetsp:Transcript_38454/g.78442  ORF Transcript_38454/g.78442 Transcript_38454/m.78442 type:complete len:560 (-) Transcript_38454:50-1729(-)
MVANMAHHVDVCSSSQRTERCCSDSFDDGLSQPPSSPREIPPFVLRAVCIASLGGILFGYDMGVVSGALPQITAEFGLNNSQREMVVSFLYLGGGLGAAVGGEMCDAVGRRAAILVTDAVFAFGAALLYWAPSFTAILMGRIVVGFGVSVSGIADVAYLHEISPTQWRGSIVSVNEACISMGFLLAYIAGYGIGLLDPEEGWRTMFGISALVALLQFVGIWGMPESPQWLLQQGRTEEAMAALKKIDVGAGIGGDGIEYVQESVPGYHIHCPPENISSLKPSDCTHPSYDSISKGQSNTIEHLMVSASSFDGQPRSSSLFYSYLAFARTKVRQAQNELATHYRQATIAVFLSVAQQFCGHTNVLNYAPEIFQLAGFESQKSSLGATLIIGIIKFCVTCLVIWKIEFLGRKFLLLAGMSTIAVSLVLLSFAFSSKNDDDSFSTGAEYVAMSGCFGVALGYAMSFGPLTWLLTSEMFPTSIRGRALGGSTIITYLSASAVSCTFLTGQDLFGPAVPFMVYCIVTLSSVVFAALAIPEMGGKSPEEIEEEMKRMWWWRQRGG